jgi:hypothetical protein
VIVRRLTICVLAVIGSAGCIVNATPDEGASPATTTTAPRVTETVPTSPNSPQQPTTNVVTPTPVGDGYQTMESVKPDPPPPRPWEPGPNAQAIGAAFGDDDQKPKIGGKKDDDGSKPTK